MLIAQGGRALQHIQTWQQNHKGVQNHMISKKKMNKKMKGCCVKNIATFLWMF